ncbi:hypothetical protein E2I00_007349 [Balaenoptera physalus]|uniref:V-type proton ATPase subunit G n=1 Tax=Balaenoptera physalus TaxID=9770 RepID=A0A6A1Q5U8_BALPH|nr:hypothetical protein E2I00_007349 [Balaenoptera physalus]
MTSQSQGIHQLLQAEKRAKDKLEEAKKKKYCESYKLFESGNQSEQSELRFHNKDKSQTSFPFLKLLIQKIMGSQSNISEEIEAQTLEKIKELNGSYNKSMESVINQLLSIVCDVKPEIHANYRIAN